MMVLHVVKEIARFIVLGGLNPSLRIGRTTASLRVAENTYHQDRYC